MSQIELACLFGVRSGTEQLTSVLLRRLGVVVSVVAIVLMRLVRREAIGCASMSKTKTKMRGGTYKKRSRDIQSGVDKRGKVPISVRWYLAGLRWFSFNG